MIDDDVLDLIGCIYDAGLDVERWPSVLERLCNRLGGHGALLYTPDLSARSVGFSAMHELEIAKMDEYVHHYMVHDLWLQRSYSVPVGQVIRGPEVVPLDEFDGSVIYNEFFRAQGIYHLLAGILFRHGRQKADLSLFRPSHCPDFDDDAHRFLTTLVPHIQRAAQTHWRIAALQNRIAADVAAFDQLSSAVFLVDGGGRVLFANRAGEALLNEGDGLTDRNGNLAAATTIDTRALRQLIAGASRTARGDGTDAGGALALARPSGRRPLSALVSPLRRVGFGLEGGEVSAIVFVSDPECETAPSVDVLRTLYGLTAAEARLAAALAGGAALKDYADEAAITLNTARWTLKQVFAKTETKSQADLIRLLLKSLTMAPPQAITDNT